MTEEKEVPNMLKMAYFHAYWALFCIKVALVTDITIISVALGGPEIVFAVIWLCRSQCARRDITEEARRYIIGRQYEAQKTVTRLQNKVRYEEYKDPNSADGKPYETYDPAKPQRKNPPVKVPVSQQLSKEYHIAPKTVEKYGRYSKALDYITQIDPNLFCKVLSGRYKISFEAVIDLARQKNVPTAALAMRKLCSRSTMQNANTGYNRIDFIAAKN